MKYFDTPETDAAARVETGGTDESPPMEVVDVKLCRKMEWQRNSARREAVMIRDTLVRWAKENGADLGGIHLSFMWESEVRLSEANAHALPHLDRPRARCR